MVMIFANMLRFLRGSIQVISGAELIEYFVIVHTLAKYTTSLVS